jgi:hypothetical protein
MSSSAHWHVTDEDMDTFVTIEDNVQNKQLKAFIYEYSILRDPTLIPTRKKFCSLHSSVIRVVSHTQQKRRKTGALK